MKAKEGSMEEEASETPEEESKEGVVLPEDFQQKVHEMMKGATTKHHLSHIRESVYQKEDEMRKKESKGKNGKEDKMMSVDTAME